MLLLPSRSLMPEERQARSSNRTSGNGFERMFSYCLVVQYTQPLRDDYEYTELFRREGADMTRMRAREDMSQSGVLERRK
jgi:hypothetical protein